MKEGSCRIHPQRLVGSPVVVEKRTGSYFLSCEQVYEAECNLGLSGIPPSPRVLYASKNGAATTGISDIYGVLKRHRDRCGSSEPGFNDDSPCDEGKQFLFAFYT